MRKTRIPALLCAALLIFTALTGCAASAQKDKLAAPETKAPETAAPETKATEAPQTEALLPDSLMLEDFTVPTIDGGSFTLSEALKDHELVQINLFATWCGPCEMEFPYLQQAWSQRSDTVAVIALSVEPEDSDEVLRDYAAEMGLTFSIGSASGTKLDRFATNGIPTSVFVDRSGRIASVDVGAKQSAREFLDLFDAFTGEDYDPNLCTYTLIAYDAVSFEYLEGVVFNFCTDTTCTPVTTTEQGRAVFTGPRAEYHVQIIRSPEGRKPAAQTEWVTAPYGETYLIPFIGANE